MADLLPTPVAAPVAPPAPAISKGILPDWLIKEQIKIEPFVDSQVSAGVISYGVTSYGYDARVGRKFKIFDPSKVISSIDRCRHIPESRRLHPDLLWRGLPMIDPKNKEWHEFFEDADLMEQSSDGVAKPSYIVIPPNSFALAETIETFEIPRHVLAVCVGKSTYARCGIIVNVTPLEPAWRGKVTVEISNTTPLPAKIYSGEGIMQILFFVGSEECKKSYADKTQGGGKYQDQGGLTMPTVSNRGV